MAAGSGGCTCTREKRYGKQSRLEIAVVLTVAFFFGAVILGSQISLLIGNSPALSAVGIVWLVIPYCLLAKSGFRTWFWAVLMRAPPDQGTGEFSHLQASQLQRTSQMLVEGLVMLGGVYGILLAFIVSDKASVAFSSWGLLVWIGLVLSIIIHLLHYTLRTMRSGLQSTLESRRNIYYCKEFIKLSVLMLAITVAMIPMFSTFPPMTIDEILSFPWGSSASYLSVMFCIWCFTAIFWLFMNSENLIGGAKVFWPTLILPYAVYFIVFSAYSPPLSVMGVGILGNAVQLPSAIFVLMTVLFVVGWLIVSMSVMYYRFVKRERRRRH